MARSTPKFTRRDFQWIADRIVELGDASRQGPLNGPAIADHFARALRGTNSGFNYDRFVRAATATEPGVAK